MREPDLAETPLAWFMRRHKIRPLELARMLRQEHPLLAHTTVYRVMNGSATPSRQLASLIVRTLQPFTRARLRVSDFWDPRELRPRRFCRYSRRAAA